MAANAKPLRQALKKETLKIKEKYKKVPESKEKHKAFEKAGKEHYKKHQEKHEMNKPKQLAKLKKRLDEGQDMPKKPNKLKLK